jgi:hypothetical protein
MRILKNLPHLQEIELELDCDDEPRATADINALTFVELPSMRKLKLLGNKVLSNDLISRLASMFPKLKEFHLENGKIPDYSFFLDSFSELENFHYRQDIYEREEDYFPRFELRGDSYSKLKVIEIEYYNEFSQALQEDLTSMINLIRAAPNLEKLNLYFVYSQFNSAAIKFVNYSKTCRNSKV